MAISETKVKIVIDNYFPKECNINTTIREAFEKGFRLGLQKAVPAADVRPVVRGTWVGDYDGYADGAPVYDMWSCSKCGKIFLEWDERPDWNFCPNCGADMRPREEAPDES